MGIFSSLKEKIFGKKEEPKPAAAPVTGGIGAAPAAAPAAAPVVMAIVDIESTLDAMPGADDLNWRSSIVDLMKLVDMDASYANRKELATELGNTSYEGSAEDNILLHKQVMKELAANGGKVPADLLD